MAESIFSATIDYEQITKNAHSIIAATKVPLMAVVKADGYGHGLVDSAKAALAGGATFLGVAFIDEAVKLRDAGITAPILAWLTPPTSDFKKALDFTIDLSISSLDQLNSLLSASNATGVTPRVHLKVDTGMTRGGALDEFPELVSAIGELLDEEKLVLVGTWSHLACADEPTHPLNLEQYRRFLAALDYMESEGINPGIRHLANSGAVTHFPEFHFDMVRSGLLLYGYFPGGIVNKQIPIKPAMELSADIALVKRVPAGASVGYGATVELESERFIALIPMGYADGIPRNLKAPINISIAGRQYSIIGRVSMDQVTVDLGSETSIKAGDRAIFFGAEAASTADDWAKAAGTISYEILSRIGGRVPRLARKITPY